MADILMHSMTILFIYSRIYMLGSNVWNQIVPTSGLIQGLSNTFKK